MLKKISKIIIFIALFFQVVYASELDLKSEKYILYNMNDNTILDSKDENTRTSIASLTKIMTVIVSIENIEDYDKKITITKDMLKDIASDVAVAGFKVGDKVSYKDLFHGAILPSGADAVNALAISVSGNKKDFVELMNKKVEELGLENTHFTNVVGLYNENNYSSAYDMAQILIYALKNPVFKSVFEARTYKYSTGKTTKSTFEKYNSKDASFITGSKTGYIKKSGFCLASTATLNDVNYLLVTLNAFSSDSTVHIKDHLKAYNYFNDNYSYQNIVSKDDEVVTLKTKYAKEKELSIKANKDIKKYVKNDFDKSQIKFVYVGSGWVSYFTEKNSNIGKIKVKYNDEIIDEFDLIYNQTLTFSLLAALWLNKYTIVAIIIIVIVYVRRAKENKNNSIPDKKKSH